MHHVACSKLRELRDGVNYASKYGIVGFLRAVSQTDRHF